MVKMMDLYQPGSLLGFLWSLSKMLLASIEIFRVETAMIFFSHTFWSTCLRDIILSKEF